MTADALFQGAVEFTLTQEGGWADDPADPGGATMHGITLAVFRAWRHDPAMQPGELRDIQMSEVEAIYRALYWNPIAGASLPPGLGLSVFDTAVNLGVRRSTMLLQAAIGVTQDGAVGPITISEAIRAISDTLLSAFTSEREAFYRRCAEFRQFGEGWLRRSAACLLTARRVAGISVTQTIAPRASQAEVADQATTDDLNKNELAQVSIYPGTS